jgi:L-rhamnose mutarotase
MKTIAYTINLKNDPQIIEKYKEHHRNVWPEVIEASRKIGIKDSKIFLLGNRLFMVVIVEDDFDPKKDMESYASGPREREWDLLMRDFQVRVPEAGKGEWWAHMECVFDLDWY